MHGLGEIFCAGVKSEFEEGFADGEHILRILADTVVSKPINHSEVIKPQKPQRHRRNLKAQSWEDRLACRALAGTPARSSSYRFWFSALVFAQPCTAATLSMSQSSNSERESARGSRPFST